MSAVGRLRAQLKMKGSKLCVWANELLLSEAMLTGFLIEFSRRARKKAGIMIKVFLREKKLKHGKKGLYLDFYPPIVHPQTAKPTRREHLRLYVYERPKAETEKNHNKETKLLGENIRA